MEKNNEKKIMGILGNYAATIWAKQTRDLRPETYAAYARVLSDVPIEAVEAAMAELSRTNTFWPSAAEIFEETKKIIRAINGEEADESAAWEEVQREVRRVWLSGRAPDFTKPEIALAVKRYGWHELCTLQMDAVGIARAQFCRFYREIIDGNRERARMAQVMSRMAPAQLNQLRNVAQLVEKIG